jgi:predicted flap endonuclease-1-like 5' DNA nuclease
MRLDYTLYILAALFFIITAVALVVQLEQTEKSLWVVTTVVLGLLSIGLGYYQRPKTEAQACQPAVPIPQTTMPETQPATTMEAPKEEKAEAPMEKAAIQEAPTVTTSATATMELTQVKGIGEKRATQLKALGINSVDELANASAETIAEKLKVSQKIVDKWIVAAKGLKK